MDENKISLAGRYVIRLCEAIIEDVRNGKCSEDDIENIIAETEPRHIGYIDPKDYLNADKAARYLGVSRNDLFILLKRFKVKCTKINNVPIGYNVNELNKIKKRKGRYY